MQIQQFKHTVYSNFKRHRRILPWRTTSNPYHILVSEIMLQQTQVTRVIEKYNAFIKELPTIHALAEAPLKRVLTAWQGLGYNRRALALKKIAETVAQNYNGNIPREQKTLETLPGIGSYTASAIRAFAFNEPALMIETNIRTVFIHHFFQKRKRVYDNDILPLVSKTLEVKNPRMWYWALMDYGAHLKATHLNPSRKSAHYTKQSPFQGSRRQIRGAILTLLTDSPCSFVTLSKKIGTTTHNVKMILLELEQEGFIRKKRYIYSLA